MRQVLSKLENLFLFSALSSHVRCLKLKEILLYFAFPRFGTNSVQSDHSRVFYLVRGYWSKCLILSPVHEDIFLCSLCLL